MGAVRKPGRRSPWSRADLAWPALLLLFTVGAAAGAVAASNTHHGAAAATTTTPAPTTTAPATTTTATRPATTTTTATATVTTTASPRTTRTTPAPAGGAAAWPAGVDGYTDVLESIPLSAGRAFAVSRALAARRSGLPHAGLLVSSNYPSLRAGYFVVFSGVYGSSAAATAALAVARSRGFTDAYQAHVAR